MTIRRSFHFNTQGAARKDGVYYNDPCDIHHRTAAAYAPAPYAWDADSTNFMSIGDRPGYKPNSSSLPIDIIGSQRGRFRTVSGTITPDADDFALMGDASGGLVTINLPAISTVPRIIYFISNIAAITSTNLVVFTANGTDTIDGAASGAVQAGGGIYLFADTTANQWRAIARRSRIQEVYKNLSGPFASTNSGSYSTLVTSGSLFFRGVPTLFIVSTSARDVNGAAEWWKVDYALRFDSGADNGIGVLTNNQQEQHEHTTVSSLLYPPVGSHTVSLRWKRSAGAGTITMDSNDQIIIHAIEI